MLSIKPLFVINLDAGCPPSRVIRDKKGRFAGCLPAIGGARRITPLKGSINIAASRARKQFKSEETLRNRKLYATKVDVRFYKPAKPNTSPEKILDTDDTATLVVGGRKKKSSSKRVPTDRNIVDRESLSISNGKIRIWKSKNQKSAVFDSTFKYKENKDFEYSTDYKGQKVVLNTHKGSITLKGDTVDGVPPFHKNIKSLTNQKLFDDLAQIMSYVEDKENSPPAISWSKKQHGGIDKALMTKKNGEQIEYGKAEIHHDHQFSKVRFDTITDKLVKGEITERQAKDEMRQLLVKDPSNKDTGYAINVAEKGNRKMVLLAGGTHNLTSNLYLSLHPLGINPDALGRELVKFGLPKTGKSNDPGNRDGFARWRGNFWKNYYRREAFVIQKELNRRVRENKMTTEEAQDMWSRASDRMVKIQNDIRALRAQAERDRLASLESSD